MSTESPASAATSDKPAEPKPAEPKDQLVSTTHTKRIGGTDLTYVATTGRLVVREEVLDDGVFKGFKPKAEVGVTSYVKEGADPTTRPVTFAFNGGPGSASVWLHLGLLGPVRIVMGDAGSLAAPPYALADNAESLLAVSDLVFIDPVWTGHSRVVEGEKSGTYSGFTKDLELVSEVIRLWTTRHGRWMSPKFLCGESYGTLRAVAVAHHLQASHSMYLNGLMLISSVLNFDTLAFEEQRNDRAHILYLPTYAAIAQYHGKLGDVSLQDAVRAAEEYASREYPYVLAQGSRLSAEERSAAATRIAELVGVTPDYVERSNLRLEHFHFFTELQRDRGLQTGRLDGRFTGPLSNPVGSQNFDDPSLHAIAGPYGAAYHHYLHHDLDFHEELPHEQLNGKVWPWSYKEFEGRPIDVSDKLEDCLRRNPHLRVHTAYGYFDGATPHFAAEEVIAHLRIPDQVRERNFDHKYYEAGHMMYVHEPSRVQQCADLINFVRSACPNEPS